MQNYVDILGTDLVKNSRERINNNIKTVASNYSGDEFPTDNLEEGMTCYRTDRKEMYIYTIDENDYGRWLSLFRFNEDGEVVVVNATTAEQLEHPPIIPDPVPTGCVQSYAGITIPNGWLLCDGSAISRTAYAALYAVIGTTYGVGDGTSTFNLPNLTSRVIVGSGSSYPLASTGGEASHTLTEEELAVHGHTLVDSTATTSSSTYSHNHDKGSMDITGRFGSDANFVDINGAFYSINDGNPHIDSGLAGGGHRKVGFSAARNWTGVTSTSTYTHDHTITINGNTNSVGSGAAHNNMQPYIALKYIIKC